MNNWILILLAIFSSVNLFYLTYIMVFKKSQISAFKQAMCHLMFCFQILFIGIYAQYTNERHYLFEFTYMLFTMTGHYLSFKIGRPKNFKVIRGRGDK